MEKADLNINPDDPRPQTIYAIKDDNAVATIADPRAILVQQTLTADGAKRTSSKNAVNLRTGSGWFIDFPDAGERVNIDPKLDAGLLIAPTTVPSDTVCAPGGYGWLNYFNYLVGNNNDGIVSQKYDAPIVGVNIYYTPDGNRHFGVVTSKNPTPDAPDELPPPANPLSFQGKRVIWRELIP